MTFASGFCLAGKDSLKKHFPATIFASLVEVGHKLPRWLKWLSPLFSYYTWNPVVSWHNKYKRRGGICGPRFPGSTTVLEWSTSGIGWLSMLGLTFAVLAGVIAKTEYELPVCAALLISIAANYWLALHYIIPRKMKSEQQPSQVPHS